MDTLAAPTWQHRPTPGQPEEEYTSGPYTLIVAPRRVKVMEPRADGLHCIGSEPFESDVGTVEQVQDWASAVITIRDADKALERLRLLHDMHSGTTGRRRWLKVFLPGAALRFELTQPAPTLGSVVVSRGDEQVAVLEAKTAPSAVGQYPLARLWLWLLTEVVPGHLPAAEADAPQEEGAPAPVAEVVSAMEKLLEGARAGLVRGVAIGYVTGDTPGVLVRLGDAPKEKLHFAASAAALAMLKEEV